TTSFVRSQVASVCPETLVSSNGFGFGGDEWRAVARLGTRRFGAASSRWCFRLDSAASAQQQTPGDWAGIGLGIVGA
ncbi:MAG: hypothetical protein QGG09_09375, partial [Pirellulaceae bacterium]|nr:hypothetical protein [Pirellulaceae bacterium]